MHMQPYFSESKQTLYSMGDISHMDEEMEIEEGHYGVDPGQQKGLVRGPSHVKDAQGNQLIHVGVLFTLAVFLEVLTILSLGVLAYYLRFTAHFPVYERLFSCSNTEIRHPYYSEDEQGPSLINVTQKLFYGLSLGIPAGVVILGELGSRIFMSSRPQKILVSELNCRIALLPRRMMRFLGMLTLGVFLTAILTDCTKILSGRHRPHFIAVCQPEGCHVSLFLNSSTCQMNATDIIREAKLSFPSFHAALAMFSALYTALYVHQLLSVRGTYTLRPVLVVWLLLMTVALGYHRMVTNWSHWEDILTGYTIGAFIAFYMVLFVLRNFGESYSVKYIRASASHLVPDSGKDCNYPKEEARSSHNIPRFLRWLWIPRAELKNRVVNQAVNQAAGDKPHSCGNGTSRQPVYAYLPFAKDSTFEMGPQRYEGYGNTTAWKENEKVSSLNVDYTNPLYHENRSRPAGVSLCDNCGQMNNWSREAARETEPEDAPPRFLRRNTVTDRF